MAKQKPSFSHRFRGALDVIRGRSFPLNEQRLMVAAQNSVRAARHFERERRSLNSYDAGKTGRLREDWGTTTNVPYYELLGNHRKIRARSRELYKNDPTYRSAINTLVNQVVGKGLRPKPSVIDYNNNLNVVINAELERASHRYFETKDWDAGGRHNFIGEGQRLAFKTQMLSGDVLLNAVYAKPGRYLPIAWQMVEIDRLDDSYDTFHRTFDASQNIKQTVHGISLDEYGAPIKYYFKGVEKPVSARNIIHSYLQERPEQYVGEPLGTAILDAVYDKHDLDEDYVLKSRAVAKFLWWLSTFADKVPYSGDQDSDGVISVDSLTQMRTEEMPDIFKMPDDVSKTIEPLLKMKKHDICSSLGLSYISVLLDMSGVNFAAASMNDIKEHVNMGVLREKFIETLCQPVWESFVRTLVVEGRLTGVSAARFKSDPYHYSRCVWTHDPREHADPSKTARARIENITSKRYSLTEDLAERGKDIREHINELKMEKELQEAAGITIAQNPPESEQENQDRQKEQDEQDRVEQAVEDALNDRGIQ